MTKDDTTKMTEALTNDGILLNVAGLARISDFISKSYSMDSVTFDWINPQMYPKCSSNDPHEPFPCYSYVDEPLLDWRKDVVLISKTNSYSTEVCSHLS